MMKTITIRCRCGCGETLEYDGINKVSKYINGHDKREKPIEIKTEKRNISKMLKDLKTWKFTQSRRKKTKITRSDKKRIREEFDNKCVICSKSQDDQISLALAAKKRPTSLVVYSVVIDEELSAVPLCSECFKLARTDKKGLDEKIFISLGVNC